MSLLLEALKKSGQNKPEGEQSFASMNGPALTAREAETVSGYRAENILEFSLESEVTPRDPARKEPAAAATAREKTGPADESVLTHGNRSRKETGKARIQERATTQTHDRSFQKQESRVDAGSQRRYTGLVVIGILLVVLAGGAYYVWQEISRLSGGGSLSGVAPLPRPADRLPPAPSALPGNEESGAVEPAPTVSAAAPPVIAAPDGVPSEKPVRSDTSLSLASSPTLSTPYPRMVAAPYDRSSPSKSAEREGVRQGKNRNRKSADEPAVRFQHSPDRGSVAPLLAAAYEAYVAGELEAARQLYLKQLQVDPTSKDVLLGLAAIATRMQQPLQAKQYYQQILEMDQRDASAVAGLAGLGWMNDSSQTESRIKTLLAQQPDAASLHFMLGNHYTGQSRWAEAQQSYFRAFSIEPVNADYAFNLAVSLDHLGQGKLAREYYGKALKLSGTTPASFDREQVSKRLDELSQ